MNIDDIDATKTAMIVVDVQLVAHIISRYRGQGSRECLPPNDRRSAASRASSCFRLKTSLPRTARRLQRPVGPPFSLAGLPPRRRLYKTLTRKRHSCDATGRLLSLECRDDGVHVIAMFPRDRLAVPPHFLDDRISTHSG